MAHGTSPSIFETAHHSPSMWTVKTSLAAPKTIRDFCIPVNGYFPPTRLLEELANDLPEILKYYPTTKADLEASLSALVGLPADQLVLGNGSTELISWIDELFVRERLAIPIPTFSRWTDDPKLRGISVVTLRRPEAQGFRLAPDAFVRFVLASKARTAVLCNPNNPTGAFMTVPELEEVLRGLAALDLVIVDESFLDFADPDAIPSVAPLVDRYRNLLVLKSLGKNFGLHGVRLGYAVTTAARAAALRSRIPYWNVNGLGEALLRRLSPYLPEYEVGRRRTVLDAREFEAELRQVPGLTVYPSRANFVYVKMPAGIDGVEMRSRLLTEHGLLVRECGNKEGAGTEFFRFASRPPRERALLVGALRDLLR